MPSLYESRLRAGIRQRLSPSNRESVAEIADCTDVHAQTHGSWCHHSQRAGWRQVAETTNGHNAPNISDQNELQCQNQELIRQDRRLERELQKAALAAG
jgi:hypothetical protein